MGFDADAVFDDEKESDMRRSPFAIVMWLMIFVLAATVGNAMDFKEGEWEVTVSTEMPSMGMKMPGSTYKQCMQKDQPVPQDKQPGQQCEMKDQKKSGNSVTWTMECSGPGGKMTGNGKVTYKHDQMNGTMTMVGQGMKMISTFSGKYIGPCP